MLSTALPRVMAVVPKGVSAERLFSVAYVALERNPRLLDCTPISILRCVVLGTQLGLDVSGVGNQAFMVPYRNNRTGRTDAQFITGWQGLIELSRRSRDVAWIYSNIVYKNERFSYIVDPIPRLQHVPLGADVDRGKPVGAYALAVFRDKDVPPQPLVMTVGEIERIRGRSRAKDDGPWVTDWEAMARKTTVRQLCKFLPQNPDVLAALDLEDRVESGEEIILPGEIIPAEVMEAEKPTQEAAERARGAEGVKARARKRARTQADGN